MKILINGFHITELGIVTDAHLEIQKKSVKMPKVKPRPIVEKKAVLPMRVSLDHYDLMLDVLKKEKAVILDELPHKQILAIQTFLKGAKNRVDFLSSHDRNIIFSGHFKKLIIENFQQMALAAQGKNILVKRDTEKLLYIADNFDDLTVGLSTEEIEKVAPKRFLKLMEKTVAERNKGTRK
ncbi:MAG: hypothetical protein P0S95_06985 [Rhabdochlamydiaceae bacterium]|nr:hypothetical protein [Candidatus Amphrikana amoebophyrae]